MSGSIWIASHVSWWIIVCSLVASTTGTLYVIRKITEGRVYDVAYSSMPGDLSLALYCGTIALICHKTVPAGLHTQSLFHEAIFLISTCTGIGVHVIGLSLKDSQAWYLIPAQWYHNLFMIPVYSYAVLSTLPILWHTKDVASAILGFGFLMFWVFAFIIDVNKGNLNPSINLRMIEVTRENREHLSI